MRREKARVLAHPGLGLYYSGSRLPQHLPESFEDPGSEMPEESVDPSADDHEGERQR